MADASRALGGAASGAAVGTAILPGWGTAAGAVVGGLIGAFSGNDDADQAQQNIQNALNQLQQLGVPPNEAGPLLLQQLQVGGKLTPQYEQAMSNVAASSVQENPGDRQNMLSTLSALRGMSQGGLNPEQMANAQKLQSGVNANTTSQIQGLLQRQAQQGKSGAGDTLASELNAVQGGAQNESQGAANIGAQGFQAQQSALQQLMSGQSNLRSQDIGEATTNANLAQQAALYNNQNSSARNARNTASANAADQANWGRQNQVGDTNVLQANQEQVREANAAQQNWEDQMQLAQAKANAYTGAAGAESQMANNSNQAFGTAATGIGTVGLGIAKMRNDNGDFDDDSGGAGTAPNGVDYSTATIPSSSGFTMAEGGTIPDNQMLHMMIKKYAQGGQVQQPDPTVVQNAPMTPITPVGLPPYNPNESVNQNASMNTQANMMNRYARGGQVKSPEQAPMVQPVNLNVFGAYATGGSVEPTIEQENDINKRKMQQLQHDKELNYRYSGFQPPITDDESENGTTLSPYSKAIIDYSRLHKYATGGEVQKQDMLKAAEPMKSPGMSSLSPEMLEMLNKQVYHNTQQPQAPVQYPPYNQNIINNAQMQENMAKDPMQKYAMGGHINFTQGGPVPGKPMFPGNNYANDVVPAMVSPGEIVVPNTASHDPEKAKAFVEDEIYKNAAKMHGPVFQRLHERLKKVEGKKGNK